MSDKKNGQALSDRLFPRKRDVRIQVPVNDLEEEKLKKASKIKAYSSVAAFIRDSAIIMAGEVLNEQESFSQIGSAETI